MKCHAFSWPARRPCWYMNWIVVQYRQSEVLVSLILGAEWNCLAIKQQALRFQVKTRIGHEPSAESVKVEDRRKSLQQQKEELCKVRCFLHLLTRFFFPFSCTLCQCGFQWHPASSISWMLPRLSSSPCSWNPWYLLQVQETKGKAEFQYESLRWLENVTFSFHKPAISPRSKA